MTCSHLLQWAHRGTFAIIDQGLFAGTNFLINILLARWLDPAQYGAFAVAYSAFLLLTTFHTAVITEPMMVFGPGKYADHFPRYVGLLIRGHWWTTGGIALLLACAALALQYVGPADLSPALFGLALASPVILLMWLVRRAFYVRSQPHWAATGGLLYLILMLVGAHSTYQHGRLSAASALVMMGVAALVVSLWLTWLLQPYQQSSGPQPTASTVLADHWAYGKWATSTGALSWASSSIFYLILPLWVGLEGSAALRAVMNLTMPALQVYSAVSVILLPLFVAMAKRRGHSVMLHNVRRLCGVLTVTAMCYGGGLVVFHHELFGWIYGGRYADQTGLLMLAGLTLLPWSVTTVVGAALRAMERLEWVFWCQGMATITAILAGLWLLPTHGAVGAAAGGLASAITAAITMTWALWKRTVADPAHGERRSV